MNPGPDKRVHDRVVFAEIEMYGELIIAASGSDGPLSEEEIDKVLGVRRIGQDGLTGSESVSAPGRQGARCGRAQPAPPVGHQAS